MKHKVYEGQLNAQGKRFCLLVSRFNDLVGARLLEGAQDCLLRHGAEADQIDIVWVPGSFEIPGAASKLAASKRYDAVVCLGAVIRGDTPHFDYIAAEVAKGVAHVTLEARMAVSFGVLTTDTIEQAIERAGSKAGNKGAEAAMSAIEMANLLKQM